MGLFVEPNKSTLEGFLSGRSNGGMQRATSSEIPQQVIHVVDMLPTTGPNIFRLVPNADGTVSFVSFPPQLNRQDQDGRLTHGLTLIPRLDFQFKS